MRVLLIGKPLQKKTLFLKQLGGALKIEKILKKRFDYEVGVFTDGDFKIDLIKLKEKVRTFKPDITIIHDTVQNFMSEKDVDEISRLDTSLKFLFTNKIVEAWAEGIQVIVVDGETDILNQRYSKYYTSKYFNENKDLVVVNDCYAELNGVALSLPEKSSSNEFFMALFINGWITLKNATDAIKSADKKERFWL